MDDETTRSSTSSTQANRNGQRHVKIDRQFDLTDEPRSETSERLQVQPSKTVKDVGQTELDVRNQVDRQSHDGIEDASGILHASCSSNSDIDRAQTMKALPGGKDCVDNVDVVMRGNDLLSSM